MPALDICHPAGARPQDSPEPVLSWSYIAEEQLEAWGTGGSRPGSHGAGAERALSPGSQATHVLRLTLRPMCPSEGKEQACSLQIHVACGSHTRPWRPGLWPSPGLDPSDDSVHGPGQDLDVRTCAATPVPEVPGSRSQKELLKGDATPAFQPLLNLPSLYQPSPPPQSPCPIRTSSEAVPVSPVDDAASLQEVAATPVL